MSRYDQRMLKPRSNLLYFQLIPTILAKIENPSQYNTEIQTISFKLYKGSQLIDQTKMSVPVVQLNGYYSISRIFLNFNVSPTQNQLNQFVIKVGQPCGKSSIIDMIYDEKSYDTHMGEDLIGECLIKLDHFIDQFTNKEAKFFRETVQISDKFALKFDLFVEKTRFMLQKYVRSMRDSIKQNDEIKIGKIHGSEAKRKKQTSPYSQRSEKIASKGYENVFISPFRSLEKNRKLIVRNSTKKNNTTIIQQDSGIYSKSFNRNESGQNKKMKGLLKPESKTKNKSQQPNNSEIQDDPLKDLEQSNQPGENEDNFDRNSYGSTEQIEIKMVKSEASSRRTKKNYKKGTKAKQIEPDKIKQAKMHIEPALTVSQHKKINKDISMKILSIVFTVFALILMLKVMSPSKKV